MHGFTVPRVHLQASGTEVLLWIEGARTMLSRHELPVKVESLNTLGDFQTKYFCQKLWIWQHLPRPYHKFFSGYSKSEQMGADNKLWVLVLFLCRNGPECKCNTKCIHVCPTIFLCCSRDSLIMGLGSKFYFGITFCLV